ncbi:hypothetical protein PIB30_113252, partial [Stylosanthes scabra]|nr:hypothetical protein [Stylosanthes scabra]
MGEESQPSIILGRPFLATGRTLIDVQKGEMVINVFEAMQHPEDEEAEECMRTDIIDLLVKEIQDEELLKKSTAYYEETFATFSDTNLEFFVQENNAELQKIKEINKEEILKSEEEGVQKSLHSTFKNKARKLWDPG